MRGLRLAGLVAFIGCTVAAVASYWNSQSQPPSWLVIPLLAVALAAWRRRAKPTALVIALVVLLAMGATVAVAVTWVTERGYGLPDLPLQLSFAACLALTLTVVVDLLLRRVAPESGACRAASWRPQRPNRGTALGAVMALAVILVPTLLIPVVAPSPVTSVTATRSVEPTGLPNSVAGDLAWSQRLNEPIRDVVAGAVGPILITTRGAIGLDGNDGSRLWSYTHDQAELRRLSGARYAATSPDRTRVAFRMIVGPEERHAVVVLDTVSGEVIAQEFPKSMGSVQLTNNVALINNRAISLRDGSLRWAVDYVSEAYLGTAGRHTLILGMECEGEGAFRSCTLTLADDQDPAKTRKLSGVPWQESSDEGAQVVDGWVARYTDGHLPQGPNPEKGYTAAQMEAVELDAVDDDGAVPSGEAVPLGVFVGTQLSARSQVTLTTRFPVVGAVFHPATGTVTKVPEVAIEYFAAWPTPDTGVATFVVEGERATGLALSRTNGAAPITVEFESALLTGHAVGPYAQAVATPGCVVAWVPLYRGETRGFLTSSAATDGVLLYCLR